MSYLPITHHGLIGDLHTAALVGCDGQVVWLPWPRFDSPSVFAAILDHERGGGWLLTTRKGARGVQRYDGETGILVTELEAETGRAELHDWMVPWEDASSRQALYRLLRCVEGKVTVFGSFVPRPDYARQPAALLARGHEIFVTAHGHQLTLASNHPWSLDKQATAATLSVSLRQGEELWCMLHEGEGAELQQIHTALEQTRRFWRGWIAQCTYAGPWDNMVRRSAITLKLLTYAPTGAIVAAPTTSLPEQFGGIRNWDYRYTWLRDASFSMHALYLLGYHQEARAFFRWLGRRTKEHTTPLQIMYGVEGEVGLREQTLDHLEGYRRSRPVRIGNAAYQQRQLDVYGGVLDAAYLYELQGELLDLTQWRALAEEIDYVRGHWHEPDQGIWEMRGPPAHHTFSKLMCWLTLDRGVRLAQLEGWPYDRERWEGSGQTVRNSILQHGWNDDLRSFTQAYGSKALDASLLVMPLVDFLPPTDPRIHATVARIKQELSAGALVYRYQGGDHLPGGEGAFLLCSFWMVDALTLIGKEAEAVERFEKLLGYSSGHGLLSEEVDPATGTALGNYPQAFSHIGLINSAVHLSRVLRQEPSRPGPGTGAHARTP